MELTPTDEGQVAEDLSTKNPELVNHINPFANESIVEIRTKCAKQTFS
jgi:hypothetical protein